MANILKRTAVSIAQLMLGSILISNNLRIIAQVRRRWRKHRQAMRSFK